MTFELWLAFCLASVVLLAVPGPTVMMVVSYALTGKGPNGRSTGWATVPAVMLGTMVVMSASMLGAGAVLATSATLFSVMKWGGAAYLIYLGIKLWRTRPTIDELSDGSGGKSARAMFLSAFIVTALNPKGIAFFVAFVPQFLNPAQPAFDQLAIMESTFIVLATLNVLFYVAFAGKLRERIVRPENLKLINRVGAGFLIGAGIFTAAMRRA